jgi:DNA-directed RNA polymerase subunit RPC12/RpoP
MSQQRMLTVLFSQLWIGGDSIGARKPKIGISVATYLVQMTNFKLSERLLPNAQEKLTIQKQRLSASYHCSRCGSVQLKIIFKAGDAKVYPYFQCQDCQMEDRIS